MERDSGFYWVSLGSQPQEVAEWKHGLWWLCGNEPSFEDGELVQISGRLLPPEPNTHAAKRRHD